MFSKMPSKIPNKLVPSNILNLLRITAAIAVLCVASFVAAQTPSGQSQQQPANNQQNQQDQNSAREAGGAKGDIGPIAVPAKGGDERAKKDVPPKPKPREGRPIYSRPADRQARTQHVGRDTNDGRLAPEVKENQSRQQ